MKELFGLLLNPNMKTGDIMKIYYWREEEFTGDVVVEKWCSERKYIKEVYRGKTVPKWLNKLQNGVDLFYLRYDDELGDYVI